ncbi:hypothetical protein CLV67_110356, partial [Actinoplanes italicus]
MQLPRARRWRPWLVVLFALTLLTGASLAPQLVPPASAAAKTVYIPARWTQTGEVPWAANRTRESTNFILLWGEKSGTDPVSAPSPYNFDPNSIITQLENLYSFYVNTMRFTPETGLLAQHKIVVIV